MVMAKFRAILGIVPVGNMLQYGVHHGNNFATLLFILVYQATMKSHSGICGNLLVPFPLYFFSNP